MALAHRSELHYASRQLPTIEINGTFHSLQRPECFSAWRDDTPEDFVFAVKGSRYLTHMLRLKDALKPLANFFASGLFDLRHKLGPFLWQFPPSFAFDAERLEAFFELLPRKSRDVYCYFDNDAKVHAPFDARRLIGMLEACVSPGR